MARHVAETTDRGYKVIVIYEEGIRPKRIKKIRSGRYSLETLHRSSGIYHWGNDKKMNIKGDK